MTIVVLCIISSARAGSNITTAMQTSMVLGVISMARRLWLKQEGETINERLAAVLSKLGIKAVEAGLSMRAIYDEGIMITGDQLKIDIEGTRKSVEQSHGAAFALSLTIAYPTSENIQALLQTAHQKALALSLNAAVPTKETIADLLRKAHVQMLSLNNVVEKATLKT